MAYNGELLPAQRKGGFVEPIGKVRAIGVYVGDSSEETFELNKNNLMVQCFQLSQLAFKEGPNKRLAEKMLLLLASKIMPQEMSSVKSNNRIFKEIKDLEDLDILELAKEIPYEVLASVVEPSPSAPSAPSLE